MQLSIIHYSQSLASLKGLINQYFKQEMKLVRAEMSLFEQYDVRPVGRVHIPGVWKFRVVATGGVYYFGKI